MELQSFAQLPDLLHKLKLSRNTLFLIDIDDTLLRPALLDQSAHQLRPTDVGSDYLYDYALDQLYSSILDENPHITRQLAHQQALAKVDFLHATLNRLISVMICEPATLQAIQSIQQQYATMLTTARIESLRDITLRQVKELNLDFTQSSPLAYNSHSFTLADGIAHVQSGIMFCINNSKVAVLMELIKRTSFKPDTVVFIDDRAENLTQFHEALSSTAITFHGLHYTYMQQHINDFMSQIDPVLKNLQDDLELVLERLTPAEEQKIREFLTQIL